MSSEIASSPFEFLSQVRKHVTASTIEDTLPDSLSPQEKRCAGLVVQGYSNKMIATTLSLSFPTVNNHIYHAITKLDIRAREDLVLISLSKGSFTAADLIPGYDISRILALSPQELEVLSALPNERVFRQDKEIAEITGVGENTIGLQLLSANKKLGVNSRMHAGIIFLAAADSLLALEDAFEHHIKETYQLTHGFYTQPPSVEIASNELEVLLLLQQGYVPKEITQRVGISISAYSRIIRNLYKKLEVSTIDEVIPVATDRGILGSQT